MQWIIGSVVDTWRTHVVSTRPWRRQQLLRDHVVPPPTSLCCTLDKLFSLQTLPLRATKKPGGAGTHSSCRCWSPRHTDTRVFHWDSLYGEGRSRLEGGIDTFPRTHSYTLTRPPNSYMINKHMHRGGLAGRSDPVHTND